MYFGIRKFRLCTLSFALNLSSLTSIFYPPTFRKRGDAHVLTAQEDLNYFFTQSSQTFSCGQLSIRYNKQNPLCSPIRLLRWTILCLPKAVRHTPRAVTVDRILSVPHELLNRTFAKVRRVESLGNPCPRRIFLVPFNEPCSRSSRYSRAANLALLCKCFAKQFVLLCATYRFLSHHMNHFSEAWCCTSLSITAIFIW